MVKKLKTSDRGVLSFRPQIDYVEPDQQPGEITPVTADEPQLEDLITKRTQVKQLASAVLALATAVQAKADERAKGMKIKLDPKVDYATIQAMKRMFPDANPNEITYEQYRHCKERVFNRGKELGAQASITQADVQAAANKAITSGAGRAEGYTQLGGYNTPDASDGSLRPELDKKGQVVEPMDMDDFQINVLCILVNFLWKKFIKPIIPLPLPSKLCNEGDLDKVIKEPGTNVLGKKSPKLQEPPETQTEINLDGI